jgi:hypothetical protein
MDVVLSLLKMSRERIPRTSVGNRAFIKGREGTVATMGVIISRHIPSPPEQLNAIPESVTHAGQINPPVPPVPSFFSTVINYFHLI